MRSFFVENDLLLDSYALYSKELTPGAAARPVFLARATDLLWWRL